MMMDSSIALRQSQASPNCLNQAMLYDVDMTLGKRIKAARERLDGLTQAKLGEHFGVTDKSVSGWERDQDRPDIDKLGKLARILKVPTRWLLEGKGPPPPPEALESVVDQLDDNSRALLEAMAQTLLQRQRGAA